MAMTVRQSKTLLGICATKGHACRVQPRLRETIEFEPRTQLRDKFPQAFIAVRHEVPRAGIPQLEQSGPIITIEFGAMPRMTHKQSLGRDTGSEAVHCKLQEAGWLQKVHGLLVEGSVEACREVAARRP